MDRWASELDHGAVELLQINYTTSWQRYSLSFKFQRAEIIFIPNQQLCPWCFSSLNPPLSSAQLAPMQRQSEAAPDEDNNTCMCTLDAGCRDAGTWALYVLGTVKKRRCSTDVGVTLPLPFFLHRHALSPKHTKTCVVRQYWTKRKYSQHSHSQRHLNSFFKLSLILESNPTCFWFCPSWMLDLHILILTFA